MKCSFDQRALNHFLTIAVVSISLSLEAGAWEPGASQGDAVTDLSVDAKNRNDVVSFYHCIYKASEGGNDAINWTGSITGCQAGTTSAEFQDHVLRRINWFRAMAGVPADITFDATRNAKSQEAALMMSSNNNLSHGPPSTWICYTAGGAEAASRGNLSLGSHGVESINGYIDDQGAGNKAVGHRRWILAPRVLGMGTGDIPGSALANASNCLWVVGTNRSPALPDMTSAWPPAGFVPWETVYARWSYSFGNADFSAASVTMTHNGAAVPLTIESRADNGFGDNTIVWNAPSTTGAVTENQTYSVTISGIGGSGPSTVSYDVTVIDPNQLAEDLVITGPSNVPPSGAAFQMSAIEGASSYELSVSQVVENATSEGAEAATAGFVIDGTLDGNFRSSSFTRSGEQCFELNPPTFFASEYFEIDRDFLTGSASELTFYIREGFATSTTVLRSEISTDGGGSWISVWSRAGKGASDGSYQEVKLSLSAYANTPLRVRFVTEHLGGSLYTSGSGLGFRIDDISVSGSMLESGAVVTDLGGDLQFTLDASTAGEILTPGENYLLKARPTVGCNTFGFSEPFSVTIDDMLVGGFAGWLAGFPGALGGFDDDPDEDGIENGIEYVIGSDPTKATSFRLLPQFQLDGNTVAVTIPNTSAVTGVEIKVAISSDLIEWDVHDTNNDGSAHHFSSSIEGMSQIFFRIVVTEIP